MMVLWKAAELPLLNDCRPCWRLSVVVQFMLVDHKASKRERLASMLAAREGRVQGQDADAVALGVERGRAGREGHEAVVDRTVTGPRAEAGRTILERDGERLFQAHGPGRTRRVVDVGRSADRAAERVGCRVGPSVSAPGGSMSACDWQKTSLARKQAWPQPPVPPRGGLGCPVTSARLPPHRLEPRP